MKRFLLAMFAGALICLLLIELLLRCLPVNSGARMASTDASQPYARYLPHQAYVYSHGWQLANARQGETNGRGFTHSIDTPQPGGLLIVGDSYIESLMLDEAQTVQGQLAARHPGQVAAISAGANGLADAVKIVERFAPDFRPASIILFVEPYDLRELLSPAPAGHNAFVVDQDSVRIEHSPYTESPHKQHLLKSALFRYAYYNLKLTDWLNSRLHRENPEPATVDRSKLQKMVLSAWFEQLLALEKQYGHRTLLLIDADRGQLYRPDSPQAASWSAGDRQTLLDMAAAKGIPSIDMAPVFASHWAEHHARFDWLPADGHWNPRAHALAAAAITARLTDLDTAADGRHPKTSGYSPTSP